MYERGLAMFSAPQNYEIWLAYLSHFVERFGGGQAGARFASCSSSVAFSLEESNGQGCLSDVRGHGREIWPGCRAMRVYERAASSVPLEERYEVYCVYLQKTEEYFGVIATRPVYEKALAAVSDDKVRHISLRFAEMERQLGELDRARHICGMKPDMRS